MSVVYLRYSTFQCSFISITSVPHADWRTNGFTRWFGHESNEGYARGRCPRAFLAVLTWCPLALKYLVSHLLLYIILQKDPDSRVHTRPHKVHQECVQDRAPFCRLGNCTDTGPALTLLLIGPYEKSLAVACRHTGHMCPWPPQEKARSSLEQDSDQMW